MREYIDLKGISEEILLENNIKSVQIISERGINPHMILHYINGDIKYIKTIDEIKNFILYIIRDKKLNDLEI